MRWCIYWVEFTWFSFFSSFFSFFHLHSSFIPLSLHDKCSAPLPFTDIHLSMQVQHLPHSQLMGIVSPRSRLRTKPLSKLGNHSACRQWYVMMHAQSTIRNQHCQKRRDCRHCWKYTATIIFLPVLCFHLFICLFWICSHSNYIYANYDQSYF